MRRKDVAKLLWALLTPPKPGFGYFFFLFGELRPAASEDVLCDQLTDQRPAGMPDCGIIRLRLGV